MRRWMNMAIIVVTGGFECCNAGEIFEKKTYPRAVCACHRGRAEKERLGGTVLLHLNTLFKLHKFRFFYGLMRQRNQHLKPPLPHRLAAAGCEGQLS